MKKIKTLLILGMISLPMLAFAEFERTHDLIIEIKNVVDLLIPLAITCALLFFIWGLAVFILHAADEGKREEGRKRMMWGIVALFVIVSIWGIVSWIRSDLGIEDTLWGGFPEFCDPENEAMC